MSLTHEERVTLLRTLSPDQIVRDYRHGDEADDFFAKRLAREADLWEAVNVKQFATTGEHPTKDVVLGAWRDLDRSEALLELIDNTIDAWLRRKQKHPAKTASEVNIYIDIDSTNGQLVYEDNAGGVSLDKLEHLVVPGVSETTDLSHTIGSYKTGGKKAIFRLATDVRVTTRYWNPAGSTDEAISLQLDNEWMSNPRKYEFPYAILKDKSTIEKGQTRYVMQLREEPLGAPWYSDPNQWRPVRAAIARTYSLLMIRVPEIHIYFCDRHTAIAPIDLYHFSGSHGKGIDIRPQQMMFDVSLLHQGREHSLTIEIVLGCRKTTGTPSGETWGMDLYGNNRLFVWADQETFADFLPLRGQAQRLNRGFVNILGPNVFIPWDTHKRHLNLDREIMRILTSHKLVRDLFAQWDRAYKDIGRLGKGQVEAIIDVDLPTAFDKRVRDLSIDHRATQKLNPAKNRGPEATLKSTVFVPTVKAPGTRKNDLVAVTFTLTSAEARSAASFYGVSGDLSARATQRELSDEVKLDLITRTSRGRKRSKK